MVEGRVAASAIPAGACAVRYDFLKPTPKDRAVPQQPSSALPSDPRVTALLEAAGVWLWEMNLPDETTVFQPGFWEQYGYNTSDLEETFEFVRVVERDDMPAIVRAWRAHVEDGVPMYEAEWRMRTATGETRWIQSRGKVFERDAEGKATRLIGVYRDITHERDTEAGLGVSAAELDAVFLSAPFGLVLVAPDLTVLRSNEWARTISREYFGAELIDGQDLRDFPAQIRPERPILTDIRQALRGEPVPDRLIWIGLAQKYIELTYGAIDGQAGIAGAVVTLRDVTGRTKGERLLAQSMRLESMGLMASGIAHDFKNVLSAIVGNIDVALIESPGGEAAAALSDARSAAMRASEMVNELLTFAGENHGASSMVDVSALVHEMARYARRIPGKARTKISEELAPDIPPFEADASQLRQVILNLLVNALDATAESGSAVTARTFLRPAVDPGSETVLPGRMSDCYAVLEVEDDGPGINEESLHRIFDPFFTTKPEGHGLGLSTVLGAVRAHEATLAVDSAPGRGARFTVYFPVTR